VNLALRGLVAHISEKPAEPHALTGGGLQRASSCHTPPAQYTLAHT
jgi:hypothetical protein